MNRGSNVRALRAFGRRVRERRERLGLGTQMDCAAEIGVRQATWSEWETGRNWPDMDNAIALAKMLRLSLDEMILGG